ncbi:uncharacterized protein [Gossypium hirsutum]|uniref:Neprosin PEP catalytic domain-containing protein n=1 Tax=Gossypium hirsutum TaxID=3635 RepID=A0ABM3AMH7_GOSHI|nr:uncharacterized protein LOC121203334 [Gossypium hirsutum]
MANFIFRVFLTLVLSYLCNRVNGNANFKDVEEKLKQLNKPAVKTIQSEDGDIIDCVDIYKQPAFDHPALKNHVIQVKLSIITSFFIVVAVDVMLFNIVDETQFRFERREIELQKRACRASSVSNVAKKWKLSGRNRPHSEDSKRGFIESEICPTVWAATLVTLGYNYIGAKGIFNIWNPNVEAQDEYTTAQIWLKAGPGDNFESIESGWTVNPQLYGDKRTRLFVHWTKDSYKTTGCFDMTCSGFVQTSSQHVLGGSIGPVSTEFGKQYYLRVGIYMDPNTANWWLKIGKDIPVGYWPASTLMFYLNHSSTMVEWGGQVYSSNVKKKPHTKTGMGSGKFATGLKGNACSILNIAIVDFSMQLKYPQWVGTWADEQYCYTALNYHEGYGKLPIFYFGGPGQNYNCP